LRAGVLIVCGIGGSANSNVVKKSLEKTIRRDINGFAYQVRLMFFEEK
jgi:molybdopterin biosynthesis enzyme MoaB